MNTTSPKTLGKGQHPTNRARLSRNQCAGSRHRARPGQAPAAWSRISLLLALLLYLPQALAVLVGVQIRFFPNDPISPAATLTGSLQLYVKEAIDPSPVPFGAAKAINLSAGQTVQYPVDPIQPTDPIHPAQLYASFDGQVQDGPAVDPAAFIPSDPILPASPPPLGFQVLVGDVVAGVNVSLPVVAWSADGPHIVGTATATLSPDPAPQDKVLDDFKSGGLDRRAITCGVTDATRAGAMPGGTRRMRLVVNNAITPCNAANPYRQAASIAVLNGTGPLLIGSGLRTQHRLELSWGQALNNAIRPLNLDLTGGGLYDRIRLTFSGNDRVENVNLAVYTGLGSGNGTVAACGARIQPGAVDTSVDIPLANLRALFGSLNLADTDFMLLTLQSGSAIGAGDLALKSMVLTQGAVPNAVFCQ